MQGVGVDGTLVGVMVDVDVVSIGSVVAVGVGVSGVDVAVFVDVGGGVGVVGGDEVDVGGVEAGDVEEHTGSGQTAIMKKRISGETKPDTRLPSISFLSSDLITLASADPRIAIRLKSIPTLASISSTFGMQRGSRAKRMTANTITTSTEEITPTPKNSLIEEVFSNCFSISCSIESTSSS